MYRRVITLLLLLWLVPVVALAADVQATLNRSSVQLGDTVTLTLRITGGGNSIGTPDLDALTQDFSILGTSQNRSISIINGTRTSELTYGVALRPKRVGQLQIPALNVAGGRTRPLQLQVNAPDPGAAAAAGKDVFMQAKVDPQHAYVGQQLSYVVKLYYAINLTGGSLDVPKLAGVQVNQVGDDLNYTTVRAGRRYHVLERRYALIPQQPGKVTIPALEFQGDAIDPTDPDSFFGASAPVSASAPAVTLDVQAVPSGWGKSAWLPARQLRLSMDGWPGSNDQARVGQPLNLTMKLQAVGLPPEALPTLSLPSLDGATVYPDKPSSSTANDGPWVVGTRQRAFAVVPQRAGTLTIPAITMKWWNVLSHAMETATIPAHSVTVLPGAGGPAAASTANRGNVAAAVASTAATAVPSASASPVGSSAPAPWWRWIALGSLGLWLLSLLGWWIWRRRRSHPVVHAEAAAPSSSPRQRQLAFLAAARGTDTAAQVRCLLEWARAERPAIQHLGELAAALEDEAQRQAIAALQQRHYAGAAPVGDGVDLGAVFKRGLAWRKGTAGGDEGELPPLYPFKLR